MDRSLWSIDLWTNETHRFQLDPARREDCPTCGRGRMEHLRGESAGAALSLCGRNAVQISASDPSARLDLDQVARRLGLHGRFTANQYLVRGRFDHERSTAGDPIELTLFPNGRAIIFGTTEPEQARSIYAKYVGM
jgi:adenylyltransferase/sulfurtransferase